MLYIQAIWCFMPGLCMIHHHQERLNPQQPVNNELTSDLPVEEGKEWQQKWGLCRYFFILLREVKTKRCRDSVENGPVLKREGEITYELPPNTNLMSVYAKKLLHRSVRAWSNEVWPLRKRVLFIRHASGLWTPSPRYSTYTFLYGQCIVTV